MKNRYLHIKNVIDKNKNVGANGENVGVNDKNVGVKLNKTQKMIIEIIKNTPDCTIEAMSKYANFETRTIERNIKTLKEKSVIERVGADKNGHWVLKI